MRFNNPDELRDAVVANGDLLSVKVGEVRDAFGYKRLGKHVRDDISRRLRGLGIAHTGEIPDWQENIVRLYRMGTPIADLLDAAENPTPEHDEELKSLVSGGAGDVLSQIRALVCS